MGVRHCSADDRFKQLKSRPASLPPTVDLRRRDHVHAGGHSAYGSKGATSSLQTLQLQDVDAHPNTVQPLMLGAGMPSLNN